MTALVMQGQPCGTSQTVASGAHPLEWSKKPLSRDLIRVLSLLHDFSSGLSARH